MGEKAEAAASLQRAKMFVQQDKGEDAQKAAKEAAALFEKTGNKNKANASLRMSIMGVLAKDGAKTALDLATAELEKAKKAGDKKKEAAMLLAKAEVQIATGSPDKGLASAKEAETLFFDTLDQIGTAEATLTQVGAYCEMEKWMAGLSAAVGALEMCQKNREDKLEAETLQAELWLAVMKTRLALAKYDEAMKAAEAALVIYIRTEDDCGKAFTLYRIADAHVANAQYAKALKSGQMALELSRKLEAQKWEHDSLEVLIRTLILMEAYDEALRQAKTGVSYLQRRGDKRTTACAMKIVVQAHVAKGQSTEALAVAKDALAVFRELGDKKLEADMLQEISKLHSSDGNFDDARKAADDALPIYSALGDDLGKKSTTDMIGAVEDARGAMTYEADRKKGLEESLSKLKSAIQTRNGELFTEIIETIYKDETITLEDLEGIIEPEMEKDPDGTLEFMKENHPEGMLEDEEGEGRVVHSSGGVYTNDGERKFDKSYYYDRRFFYLWFRMTGMGYGPGLRTLKTGFRLGELGAAAGNACFGISTQTVKEDCDDWEPNVGWHAGLLDCALQSGTCRGTPLSICENITKREPGNFKYNPKGFTGTAHCYTSA